MSRANEQATAGLREIHGMIGGPLIPVRGMTIREVAAIAAMQGIIANGRTARGGSASIVLDVASEAREYADALIDELEKEPRK